MFAAIPEGHVVGMRAPFLLNGGNEMYRVLAENDFKYDCTWPTRQFENPGLWPYTLDYKSKQVSSFLKINSSVILNDFFFIYIYYNYEE